MAAHAEWWSFWVIKYFYFIIFVIERLSSIFLLSISRPDLTVGINIILKRYKWIEAVSYYGNLRMLRHSCLMEVPKHYVKIPSSENFSVDIISDSSHAQKYKIKQVP